MLTLLAVLGAYLIGSISFAVVTSRLFGLPDPRSYGSGNPGATNVLRTGKKAAAALTLIGDAAKGALAVLLARWLDALLSIGDGVVAGAALAAFVGHLYPVYFGFKGGKGVATAFGIVLALSPWLALVAFVVFLGVVLLTRFVSLASMLGSVAAAGYAAVLFGPGWITAAVVSMAMLIVWRHRANVRRLLAGEESRIALRKAAVPPAEQA